MAKGRRPKPTTLKVLRGTFQPSRDNKAEPQPSRGAPPAPDYLDVDARAEWDRLCVELDDAKILTTADRGAMEVASTSHGLWRKAERAVAEKPTVYGARGGLVANPMFKVLNDSRAAYFRALVELGLPPAARSKVKVRKGGEHQEEFPF